MTLGRWIGAWLLLLGSTGLAAAPRWGCDLSIVPRLEAHGATFARADCTRSAPEILRAAGVDVLRLRLWHSPSEPWHGIDSVLAFAARAQDLGYELLLDLHYSDTWADPAHQALPAAWESLNFAQLEDSVYRYTNNVMRRFRDAGVLPEAVQIGNEIGGGMLWNWGRIGGAFDTPTQWNQLTSLLDQGVRGVRDSLPPVSWPRIVMHHQEGGDADACIWFFDHLVGAGVVFDVIGLSYYPWWHGTINDLVNNVTALNARYGCSVQIVETAYPYTTGWCDSEPNIVGEDTPLLPAFPATPLGQAFYLGNLRDRLAAIPGLDDPLICLWEPAWIPTATFMSPWENLALFDCAGDAQPALDVFPGLTPRGLTIALAGNDLRLRWNDDANLYYQVFAYDAQSDAAPVLLGTTGEHEWILENEILTYDRRCYFLRGSVTP
ncbi:MAG: glycosyl hydrolase 53 family protein [bacterium]|nr:glycosyl hydrolase 53 family protein [bacterium]